MADLLRARERAQEAVRQMAGCMDASSQAELMRGVALALPAIADAVEAAGVGVLVYYLTPAASVTEPDHG